MAKPELTESNLEYMFDSDEESVTSFDDLVGDKDDPLKNRTSSSDSDESIEITPVNSPDISDSENELPVPSSTLSGWDLVTGSRNMFTKTFKNFGVDYYIATELIGKDPIDFYNYFIDDEVIALFVTETNRYALNNMESKSKIKPWSNTDSVEMRQFIGILLWMSFFHLPEIRDYWSKNVLYENNISKIMTRNRFEQLLKNIHFCDNTQSDKNNSLYKISTILDIINKKFQQVYTPGEEVCINESNTPFCGRMYYRQYISNKQHRYGIKLCTSGGYTWRYKVYTEEERREIDEKVVMELMNGLLDSGRTLYTNNLYTSVPLAKMLIKRNTYLVGTLLSSRKNIPEKVIQKKLKKGEIVSQQNEDKIVVLKWKNKRDVLMLSTKHDDSMVNLTIKDKNVSKPAMVIDYSKGKRFIDLSDQIAAYSPYFQRTIKWYKRLVLYLITATTVVNAHYLYNKVSGKTMQLNKFRELLVQAMTNTDSSQPIRTLSTSTQHILKEVEGHKRQTRRRCRFCYKNLSISNGSAYARKNAKKINTICDKCKIPVCLDCFQKYHQIVS